MSSSKDKLLGVLGVALAGAVFASAANAVEDLSQLQVTPQRGQSAEQARRDRYECHNWAVEQTGETPIAVPRDDRGGRSRAEREKRADVVNRVVNGAAIGAGLGGLVRATQDEDPSHGVLAGAAVGAAVGAATARDRDRRRRDEPEPPSNYLRALSACMEGRGYDVALPGVDETVARR